MNEFFIEHPVFTLEDFKNHQVKKGTKGPRAAASLLTYYLNKNRLLRIKRGIYAFVPPVIDRDTHVPDPYLIASKISDDAVLAYHTALELHGNAYSVQERLTCLTKHIVKPFTFQGRHFHPVVFPKQLRKKSKENFGVITIERNGLDVRVTTLERTLVDVLDRPQYSGSWEEIWRSLESIEFFDLDKVVEYTLLLDNATTTAKVGFFLEQNKDRLFVEDKHLAPLKKAHPLRPHYLNRTKRESGTWIKQWNLIVPHEVINKNWSEVS